MVCHPRSRAVFLFGDNFDLSDIGSVKPQRLRQEVLNVLRRKYAPLFGADITLPPVIQDL